MIISSALIGRFRTAFDCSYRSANRLKAKIKNDFWTIFFGQSLALMSGTLKQVGFSEFKFANFVGLQSKTDFEK